MAVSGTWVRLVCLAGALVFAWVAFRVGVTCFDFPDLDLWEDEADLAFEAERERPDLGFVMVLFVLGFGWIIPKESCSTSGTDDSSGSSGSSKSFSGEAFSPSMGRGTDQGKLRPTTR